MKKLYLIFIAILVYNFSWGQNVFFEGFESGNTNGTAISNWTQSSITGTGVWTANNNQTTYNRTPRSGLWNAYLVYSNTRWIFKSVSLTAGQNYKLSLYARQDGSTSTNASITLKYGNTDNDAGMTGTILAETGIINGNYQLLQGNFTPSTTGTYYIGILGKINGTPWYISIDDISLDVFTPLSGTKTIKSSGGDYANFTDAINALNGLGVGAGGVTFNVDAGFVTTEDCPIITATGTSGNPIIFQKSGAGANPIIKPTGTAGTTDAGIAINGGDYITFDGIDITENTGSALEFGYYIYNKSATDGSQNNTIKNSKITLNRTNTSSIGIYQNTAITPTNQFTGNNNNNKYYNIIVENAYNGVYLKGYSSTYYDSGCEFGVLAGGNSFIGASSSNDIGDGSSAVYGIRASYQSGVKIFGTTIRNLNSTSNSSRIAGIFLENAYGTSEIYNNKIGLVSVSSPSTSGINYLVSGMRIDVASGATANIYNNMIFGLSAGQTSSTSSTPSSVIQVAGIVMGITSGTSNLYYNSIRIEGSSYVNSACIVSTGGTANTMKFKNNIFTNFTAAQSGTPKHYCIMRQSSSGTISESNYNNYYISNSGNGYIGYYTADKALLADWKTALSKDANSKNVDPNFTSSTDLHVFSIDLNAAGVTISTANGDALNITTDIDGNTRDASTPDIGADEFNIECTGAVGGTASGTAVYCGPSIPTITAYGYSLGNGSTYQWQSSSDNFVSNIIDISGQTNPASLTTGTVSSTTYYRLKVTCNTGTALDYSTVVTVTIKAVPIASAGSNTPVCTGNTLNLTGTTDIGSSFNWSGPNGFTSTLQNPSIINTTSINAGTYTFTATYDGCISSNATVDVTINKTPGAVSVSPISQTIYAGQIETLVASGGNIDGGSGIIGTNTNPSSTTTPYIIKNQGTRVQYLYTASELTSIGLNSNMPITSISFDVTVLPNTYTFNNFTIKMKNTTSSSLTTTFENGATQVFNPANVTISSTGLVTHNLTTAFTWDGTSNLLVEICLNNSSYNSLYANPTVKATSNSNKTHYYNADSDVCGIASGGSINLYRPDISLAFQQPVNKTWSPTSGLYTDVNATTAYTGSASNTVYAKPMTSTTYTATASNSGCSSNGTSAITVTPTWLGLTNTDWAVASNWNYNIPTLSDNITIPTSASNQPHITTTNAVCKNLTINNGASLTIDAGKALTVNGTLTNNAGNTGLVIKSDASLKHNTNNVAATMEREIAAANWNSADEGWHLLSSPVSSQAIASSFTPSGAGNDYDFYAWDENGFQWLNKKVVANNITTFGTGIGYLVAYQQAGVKTFAGNLNNGDVSVSLQYSNTDANKKGYTLLGNPYPCAINWADNSWDKSKIEGGSAKIWNSTTKNYTDISLLSEQIIPANQGFIVRANATGNFTIPAASRVINAQGFYKSTNDKLVLKAEKAGTQIADIMGIAFNNAATLGYDTQFDASEFETFGNAPSLYAQLSTGEKLSISTMPDQFSFATVLNIAFKARTDGQYKISASNIPAHPMCNTLFLQDSKTNTFVNLNQNPVYSFNALITDNPDRFKLHFQNTTGIEEANNQTLIYSHNGVINVKCSVNIKSIEVYNALGQFIESLSVNNNNFTFNNNLNFIIIKVITSNSIITKKIVNQ